ncbi:hypothetical protein MTDSW087_03848 [Methylobacterium dankookense]|uniref:DUF2478 domain-containing protein n=1 Tax=Methylobacterium dankookense TaxID=560405 RepID=A0A564G0Y7_9HYPH|nr:hypothetical protein IFDJLNFL_1740 [Methylobacterium dankookense]VUF14133.1 hypothetical protein MTDSW087_03848 [Methylobacterium dankookense]
MQHILGTDPALRGAHATGADGASVPAYELAVPILALQGAPSSEIQRLLLECARRCQGAGLRVAGLVEVTDGSDHRLEDVATGARYDIHQDLGSGSTACRLCGAGIAEACEAVRRQIEAGCNLAILSKFGKLEAGRGGLTAAFAAAIVERFPILTAVASGYDQAWDAFSAPLSAIVLPDQAIIASWLAANLPPKS